MSDDEHHDTPENPEDNSDQRDGTAPEPDAEAKPKRFEARKEEDQEPLSDDPEVNAIAKLGYDEIQRIADDPDHPRHEKAKEYLRLYWQSRSGGFTPMTDAINKQYADLWKNIIGQSMPKFDMSHYLPKVDMSQFAPKINYPSLKVESPPSGGNRASRDDSPTEPELPTSSPPETPASAAEEAIQEARATTAAILKTNERLSELVRQYEVGVAATTTLMSATNERLEEMLQQARSEAADQKKAAQKSDEHAEKSRRQTWWAIGVTIAVGLTQIVTGIVALIS